MTRRNKHLLYQLFFLLFLSFSFTFVKYIKKYYIFGLLLYSTLYPKFFHPLFSSLTGYCMSSAKPKRGVVFPFTIDATPEIIGNLKSKTVGRTFVLINCSRASAVNTPSDTPSILLKISSSFSPFASRIPTCLLSGRTTSRKCMLLERINKIPDDVETDSPIP